MNKVLSWNSMQEIRIICELDDIKTENTNDRAYGAYYEVYITQDSLSYSINTEKLATRFRSSDHPPFEYFRDHLSLNIRNELNDKGYRMSNSELAVTQIRDALQYPIYSKLRNKLANIAVHYLFNTSYNSPLRNSQPIGWAGPDPDIPSTRLSYNGDNLSNVFYHLHNEPKYQDYYDEILFTLRRAFPSFEEIVFPPDLGQGQTILAWKDKNFPKRAITANLLSDGALRFMCLLAALYDPKPPALICFDEPEVGLHPQLIRLLASVLQEASERMQIIVATHSAELISSLSSVEDVIVVEEEEGWSKLKRLSQSDLAHWLEEYSLGELWESGEIGGRL